MNEAFPEIIEEAASVGAKIYFEDERCTLKYTREGQQRRDTDRALRISTGLMRASSSSHMMACRLIKRRYHRLIKKTIEEQLTITPQRHTRNRKPLEELPGPFGSTCELRFGPDNRFRAFYEVAAENRTVWILAIGFKEKNRLLIAGEEFIP